MSTVAREQALADHAEKAEMGDEDHILIASKIKKAREFQKMKQRRVQVRKKGLKLGDSGDVKRIAGKYKQKHKKNMFTSGITHIIEQVLLACSILVALAGVMFESDRFANDKTNVFAWQREMITYMIIMV